MPRREVERIPPAPGAAQTVGAASNRGTSRLRIDSPAGHRPASHARTARTAVEPPSFSAQMFHLHESLAPHRGLVGAAVLAIAGGLLYWLAFARSGLTIHPSELLQFSTDSSHETAPAAITPEAAPSLPATSEEPTQAAGWMPPPRVASAKPAASEPATIPAATDEAPATGPLLTPAVEPPVPLPPVLDDLPTATMRSRSVAPTPLGTRPMTTNPAFSPVVGPAGATGAVVAEHAIRHQPTMNSPR